MREGLWENKMSKKEIFISTSTFAQYSKEPIELLEKEGFNVSLNPTGKKMTTEEIAKYAKTHRSLAPFFHLYLQ